MPKIALFKTKLFQIMFIIALAGGGGIAFAVDADNDGMSDLYENFFKLNPSNSTDSAENHDGDLLDNVAEFSLWTDPNAVDTDLDGFPDHADSNALSRAVIFWGHPDFTSGDDYSYTGPEWWVGAYKEGGQWSSDRSWRLGAEETGGLRITIDPSLLSSNLVLGLLFEDTTNSVVSLQLLDENSVLVSNLVSDITAGTGEQVLKRFEIPLTACANASRISIAVDQNAGEFNVYTSILYIDEDGDGLDADQELQVGTLDTNPDSDGDGVSDYAKALPSGSDLLLADTDGDGLSDSEEVALGLDPLRSDSDQDGLTDGVERTGSVYAVIHRSLSWSEAKADAEALGGHLVTITSEAEHQALVSATGTDGFGGSPVWIGVSDAQEEGVWRWITGEPFAYQRWLPGQPDNSNGENAASYWGAGLWNDCSDQTVLSYLIEFEAVLDPLNPDSDGDGLTDGDEVNLHHTCPHMADTDLDGINDGDEVTVGTNPLASDSDGDGLSDLEEAYSSTDPLNSDTDQDGLSDGEELNGSTYVIVRRGLTWEGAKAEAEALGGHLATITSEIEHNALVTATGTNWFEGPSLWIGASDAQEEGVWEWITGEPFAHDRWLPGQPDSGFSENYASYCVAGRWNDSYGGDRFSYIIEFESVMDPLNPDVDGDGLSDGDEVLIHHSCLYLSDTDFDGISDRDEIRSGTNPLLADTDADGLSDLAEANGPTDPFNPDADGDGLLDGAESRFILVPRFVTWPEARLDAERRGGRLVVVDSEAIHLELLARFGATTPNGLVAPWIGATDEAQEGVWKWVTGEPVIYEQWYADEPDNQGGEDYASYWLDARWNDSSAESLKPYIIEFETSLDPFSPDADGDGLSDGDEVNVYFTSPHVADTDADGISDFDEVAAGLNPCSADSDRDGLADADEPALGLDPLNPDSDGDGLRDGDELNITATDPLLADSNVAGIQDLVVIETLPGASYVERYAGHFTATWSNAPSGVVLASVGKDSMITYALNVTQPGIHHLGLQTSFDGTDEPRAIFEPRMLLEIDGFEVGFFSPNVGGGLSGYSLFTPWLTEGVHTITLRSTGGWGHKGTFTIESLELGTVAGDDINRNGIPEWMENQINQGQDFDNDGISDWEEISRYGTDPLNADTDADGLADGDELEYGTDPLDEDSDDDGVLDGEEVHGLGTDPLAAGFDGTMVVVASLAGSQTNHAVGIWEIQGSEIVSKRRRGSVEYSLDFPAEDLYGLNINAAHLWTKSSCSPVIPVDTSHLQISIDGIYVGSYPLVTADGVYVDVRAFLPVLPVGLHTVRIFWENVRSRLSLKINNVQLQSLGGPDTNGNGVKDWVETSVASMAGVDGVSGMSNSEQGITNVEGNVIFHSFVSPACVEGDARYVPFMSITNSSLDIPCSTFDIHQSVGRRWYANLPLQQDGGTEATATFQNGTLEVPINVEWVPYNLMNHDGETLLIRKGDSLKIVALPADPVGGQFEIEYLLDAESETVRSSNTRPIVRHFPDAGTYTLSGQYTRGNSTVTATVQIKVIEGAFPTENPACLVGRTREWTFEGMPASAVLEVDDTIELVEATPSSLDVEPESDEGIASTNQALRTVSLKATKTNGDHTILARLYPGGPVLDSARLDTFWVQNAVDGHFYTVERYEDSELWEVESIAKNLPDSVDLHIKVIAGGVTLDDYTLERWFTNTDYDEIGSYRFRLFHPNDADSSTCHTFKVYQDGVFIGATFFGGQNDIGEE